MIDSHQSSGVTARSLIEIVLGSISRRARPAGYRFGEKNPQNSVELGDKLIRIECLAVGRFHAGLENPLPGTEWYPNAAAIAWQKKGARRRLFPSELLD
jgi:hypothetical protein